jgi:hypothetical protein
VLNSPKSSELSEAKLAVFGLNYSLQINDKANPHFFKYADFIKNNITKEHFLAAYIGYDIFIVLCALLMNFSESYVYPIIVMFDSVFVLLNMVRAVFSTLEGVNEETALITLIKIFSRLHPVLAGNSIPGFFKMLYLTFIDFYEIFFKIKTALLCICSMFLTFLNRIDFDKYVEEDEIKTAKKIN